MDWQTFTISFFEAIAWPSVILFIALKFYEPIKNQIGKIKSATYKGLKLYFEEELDKIETELKGAVPSISPKLLKIEDSKYEDLMKINPNLVIVDSWNVLETELIGLAQKEKIKGIKRKPVFRLARELVEKEVIGKPLANAISNLKGIRNIAVHSATERSVSEEEATRFYRMANEVVNSLENLNQNN